MGEAGAARDSRGVHAWTDEGKVLILLWGIGVDGKGLLRGWLTGKPCALKCSQPEWRAVNKHLAIFLVHHENAKAFYLAFRLISR